MVNTTSSKEGGHTSRRMWYTRRRSRRRAGACRAVFLLTTTPHLRLGAGRYRRDTVLPRIRRPQARSSVNSLRLSRSRFGSIVSRYTTLQVGCHTGLDGELCAALSAASTDDTLATGCAHAHEKTMRGGTLALFWLVRSLWHNEHDYSTVPEKEKAVPRVGNGQSNTLTPAIFTRSVDRV